MNTRTIRYSLTTNRSGFTLIELMIYMGLLSVFLLVLTDIMVSTLDVRARSTSASAVSLEAEFVKRRLEYDIHKATAITSPAVGATGSSLTLTVGGSTYVYSVTNGILTLTVGGTSRALTNNAVAVTSFSVQRIGNGNLHDTLTFDLTLESATQVRGTAAETQTESFTFSKW